jgi:hypothetical protein
LIFTPTLWGLDDLLLELSCLGNENLSSPQLNDDKGKTEVTGCQQEKIPIADKVIVNSDKKPSILHEELPNNKDLAIEPDNRE